MFENINVFKGRVESPKHSQQAIPRTLTCMSASCSTHSSLQGAYLLYSLGAKLYKILETSGLENYNLIFFFIGHMPSTKRFQVVQFLVLNQNGASKNELYYGVGLEVLFIADCCCHTT